MQRALELTQSVPQRANDVGLIDSIEHYPGDKYKLGKIYRHVSFALLFNYFSSVMWIVKNIYNTLHTYNTYTQEILIKPLKL